MPTSIRDWRLYAGLLGFTIGLAGFAIGLATDLLLFSSGPNPLIEELIKRHPNVFVQGLKNVLYSCGFSLTFSFLGRDRWRAFGLAFSFVNLLLCFPLGAGV
jgi:hypothetical protein